MDYPEDVRAYARKMREDMQYRGSVGTVIAVGFTAIFALTLVADFTSNHVVDKFTAAVTKIITPK